MARVLHGICQKIWEEERIVTIPNKGDLKKCTNYRTIAQILILRLVAQKSKRNGITDYNCFNDFQKALTPFNKM